MGLIAEFRLSSPQLPLVDVAAAVPEITLEFEQEQTNNRSEPPIIVVRATGRAFDALEDAFESSAFVGEYAPIIRTGSTRLYQLRLTVSPPAELDTLALNKSVTEQRTITADGWHEKRRFSDREEFAAFREFCRENGVSFRLERLDEVDGDGDSAIGLTDPQREAIVTAYEMGYFEVPRTTSMAEVASALGIAAPSLSERFRRAEAHLVEQFVRSDLYLKPHTD